MFHKRPSRGTTTTSSPPRASSLSSNLNTRSRGRGTSRCTSRGGGRTGGTNEVKPRGLFENNTWHCDCNPRLPAEHFRVKKEGPNKGRWFYTCQKSQEERCGFFLWDEDAEGRMQKTVLGNRGVEVGRGGTQRRNQGEQGENGVSPPPVRGGVQHTDPLATGQPPSANPRKRTLPWATNGAADDSSTASESEDDGDLETLPWPSTAQDPPHPPSTPRKAQKTSHTTIPGQHPQAQDLTGLPTPQTTSTTNGAPSSRFTFPAHTTDPTTTTPTPLRFHTPTSAPPTPSKDTDITTTVLNYLQAANIHLPPDPLAGLRAILETHKQQVRGYVKGRDVAREAVRGKEGRVVELVRRVEGLEGEVEVWRGRCRGRESAKRERGGGREEEQL